jgi:hypothetical protein
MDQEIIDTVRADTLEVGDTIQFWDGDESRGLLQIKDIYEEPSSKAYPDGFYTITSEEEDENYFLPDAMVSIYGYAVVEV